MIVTAQVLWQSPWLAPWAIAALALLLAAVLWLYPPQLRDVPRGWRWLPPLLRAMAVTALAVSIIQPAVLRPKTASQQGAVVLLVDRSQSMSVSDRGRSPAELVALAAGLGALPGDARKEATPGLRAQLDVVRSALEQLERGRADAEYARISGRGQAAAQARLRDADDGLRDALARLLVPELPPKEAGELTQRIVQLKQPPAVFNDPSLRELRGGVEAAVAAQSAYQARLDEQLFDSDNAVRTACIRVGRSTRFGLIDRTLSASGRGLLAQLPAGAPVLAFSFARDVRPLPLPSDGGSIDQVPDGDRSDVVGAATDVMRRLRGRAVQAIVVMSDGRHTAGDANPDLSALGATVFSAAVAPPGPRSDLAIASVEVPSSARVGQTVPVRLQLRGHGFAGRSVDLRLEGGDSPQMRRVTIGDDLTATAEFETVLEEAGKQALTVIALPQVGEITDQNNRVQRWIKVGRDPLRVMVLAGADAGRQYASLHDSLSRARWVALREVEENQVERLTPAAILSQDVIVLCDLPPEAVSQAQWDALDALVRQRGGTVILCAGAHLPGAYAYNTSAADWLPYTPADRPAWRTWPGGTPHFRFNPDRTAEIAAPWQNLGPLTQIVPLSKVRPGVRTLLTERESGAAVITDMPRGNGRVVFIGTDETWRWRGQAGGAERERFWPHLVRLAGRAPYAANEGKLWLDASTLSPQPDQSINVRARVFTIEGIPLDVSTQTLHVMQSEDHVTRVTLRNTNTGDGRFEGTVPPLAEGDYVLRLDAPAEASLEIPPDPVTLQIHVAPDRQAEMVDLSGDERLLRRMAESSGGEMLTLDQLPRLGRLLAANRERQAQFIEYSLWDSPYLFGFVLACLSAEWSLRKKFGLA